jgi:hypothetical protein
MSGLLFDAETLSDGGNRGESLLPFFSGLISVPQRLSVESKTPIRRATLRHP